MSKNRTFSRICLVAAAALLLAGVGTFASPWYVEGGLVARFYGYAPAPGESNWLSVLGGTGASLVVGLILGVAGLVFGGIGMGGAIGGRLAAGSRGEPGPTTFTGTSEGPTR